VLASTFQVPHKAQFIPHDEECLPALLRERRRVIPARARHRVQSSALKILEDCPVSVRVRAHGSARAGSLVIPSRHAHFDRFGRCNALLDTTVSVRVVHAKCSNGSIGSMQGKARIRRRVCFLPTTLILCLDLILKGAMNKSAPYLRNSRGSWLALQRLCRRLHKR